MKGRKSKHYRLWTRSEDAFLEAHWQHMTDEQIAKRLGRTTAGVCKRRKTLRLLREPTSKSVPVLPTASIPGTATALKALSGIHVGNTIKLCCTNSQYGKRHIITGRVLGVNGVNLVVERLCKAGSYKECFSVADFVAGYIEILEDDTNERSSKDD